MNAAVEDVIHDDESNQQLVPSLSIDNLLNIRHGILKKLQECQWAYEETAEMAESLGLERYEWIIADNGRGWNPFARDDFMPGVTKRLDADMWDLLMKKSGMLSLMDAKARNEWHDKIRNCTVPPLTRENIEATFEMLHSTRGEIFERGVIQVFRNLSWDFKTNNPFRLGKRIILTGVTNCVTGNDYERLGYPNSRTTNEIDDLLRVMNILDGKPEPDHRNGAYAFVRTASEDENWEASNDYISIRLHRKGTGHVTFLRMDLVERMNQIIAKHYPGALPGHKTRWH